VLLFPDASMRAVCVKHPLELWCAACERLAFYLKAQEEPSPLMEAEPVNPYDELVDLFGRAADIKTDDRFMRWIFGLCHQVAEESPKNLQ
jgi:hypothetical protein